MIEISVVIVSYKKIKILKDCLDSIEQYNDVGNRLEVIVVDNSPTDELYESIKKDYPNVHCIKNENHGFGQANNVGVKVSQGKYLILLNPDTILVEPIFDFAIKKFENNSDLGLFGIKLIDLNLKRNMSFYFMDRHGANYGLLIKLLNSIDLYLDRHMFISGADMFIRKKTFVKCGMFDENIFMYCEEKDLIKRILLSGKKTAYYKDKKLIHLEGKTIDNGQDALIRRLDSSNYYSNKYKINFRKQIKSEILLNKIKVVLFYFINRRKSDYFKTNTTVLADYIKTLCSNKT